MHARLEVCGAAVCVRYSIHEESKKNQMGSCNTAKAKIFNTTTTTGAGSMQLLLVGWPRRAVASCAAALEE